MDYKTSGVDVEAGRSFVDKIKSSVESTHRQEVIGGLGGFGGLIRLPGGFSQPVLVSGTDGVGTKLELAQDQGAHFGVGIDLVAMCVNDVITSSADPLFFLDYIATGLLSPESLSLVVEGISAGCNISKCSLLGGETAEMPGFYPKGRYDLAGFCVGVVEESQILDGTRINEGDQIIAVESSGIHSNGFSLVRKVLELASPADKSAFQGSSKSLIDALLEPTLIYSSLVRSLVKEKIPLHAMAHITGGGLPENLPRCLPRGLVASIDINSWKRPAIFRWLKDVGEIPEKDMWNTFNLGVGYCIVLPKEAVSSALEICKLNDLQAWLMGTVKVNEGNALDSLIGLPF